MKQFTVHEKGRFPLMLTIRNLSHDPFYNQAFEEYIYQTFPDDDIFFLWQNSPAVVVGSYQNICREVHVEALRQRGIRFVSRFQGEWHDYQHVDAVLAIRDCPPVVLATKPASKLINAWKAGVPALLGPEPAYRELRTSPLDFLEAASAEAVLDSIDRLQQESGLYRRMTEHGAKRAQAFDVNMLTQKWLSLLEEARERNRRETRNPLLRYARYLWNRQKIDLGKRLSGWRD